MRCRLSTGDVQFRHEFEAGVISPASFNHRAHVRLAYVYLVDNETAAAQRLMQSALWSFLRRHGIETTKYHETLTQAWILAVRHFMENTPDTASADAFIERNPALLDSKIMMSHYSAALLFSDEARARFVEPNLAPIPRHNG
jgi:hypothetical protein